MPRSRTTRWARKTRQLIRNVASPRLRAYASPMPRTGLLFALLIVAGCATPVGAPPSSYANPVIDSDFPDPAVMRAADGFYSTW